MDALARRLVALVALVIVILAPSSLLANDAPARLVVVVEGGGGDRLRTALGASLPSPWARADAKAVAKAQKTRKLPASPKALDKPKTRGPYIDKLGAVATDVNARGALVVRVPAAKKNRKAQVLLVSPSGKVVHESHVGVAAAATPANVASAVQAAIAGPLAELGPAPSVTAPATTTSPVAERSPPPAGDPAETPPASTGETPPSSDAVALDVSGLPPPAEVKGTKPPIVDASLALELAWRSLTYEDRVTTNLRPYSVSSVFTPVAALELYPLARTDLGVLRDLGFVGSFRTAVGLESALSDGTRIQTVWTRVDGGLRARVRLAPGDKPPTLGVSVTYSQESFIFRDPTTALLDTVSVSYQVIRPRLDARVPIGPLGVFAAAGYLHVLDSGEIADRIRGASAGGVEAELGVFVPLGRVFEVRATGAYRRYFLSFDPSPGDESVAGGALDQVIRAQLGLAVIL